MVHFQSASGLDSGESIDVSARGLLLRSPTAVPIGTRLELKFHPPTWSRPVLLAGVVVRHAGSPRKLGIRFVDVPPDTERDLATYVQHHLERVHRVPSAAPSSGAVVAPPTVAGRPHSPATACGEDRRIEPRVAGRFQVVFRSDEHFLSEYATSLSSHGLFIETALPFELGTVIEIQLVLPALRERVVVQGRVVRRVSPAPGVKAGIGLKLIAGAGSGLTAIHDLAQLRRTTTGR